MFIKKCKSLACLALFAVTPLVPASGSGVPQSTVDRYLFKGKQVTVLLSRSGVSHDQIKNQDEKMDYFVLSSPEIVQIGHHSYLRGKSLKGPINIKDKIVWIEMSTIRLIKEN